VTSLNDIGGEKVIRYIRLAYTPRTKHKASVVSNNTIDASLGSAERYIHRDEVSISTLGKGLNRVGQVAENNSAVRQEKVARLQRLVANKEYHVSNEALAEKMVEYFLE
jgi:flagellar biosynthesis anti-sigma factor FlgM